MKVTYFISILFILAVATGCSSSTSDDSFACTTIVATVDVRIADAQGNAIDDADLAVTLEGRDEPLNFCRPNQSEPCNPSFADGQYTVFSDQFFSDIPQNQRIGLQVQARQGNRQTTAQFVVARDRCHVYKVEGPNAITL